MIAAAGAVGLERSDLGNYRANRQDGREAQARDCPWWIRSCAGPDRHSSLPGKCRRRFWACTDARDSSALLPPLQHPCTHPTSGWYSGMGQYGPKYVLLFIATGLLGARRDRTRHWGHRPGSLQLAGRPSQCLQ